MTQLVTTSNAMITADKKPTEIINSDNVAGEGEGSNCCLNFLPLRKFSYKKHRQEGNLQAWIQKSCLDWPEHPSKYLSAFWSAMYRTKYE